MLKSRMRGIVAQRVSEIATPNPSPQPPSARHPGLLQVRTRARRLALSPTPTDAGGGGDLWERGSSAEAMVACARYCFLGTSGREM
jgi:hypothetical protein